jgi:hypothetical protein
MRQGPRAAPYPAFSAPARAVAAVLTAGGLLAACASAPAPAASGLAPGYKLGQVGTSMSAAAARGSSELESWRSRTARGTRADGPGAAGTSASASGRPAATGVAASPGPSRTGPASQLARASTAEPVAGPAAQAGTAPQSAPAAPESVVAQRVALQSPGAATPSPVRATPLTSWSDRLWLLAALLVLALAATAAWIVRPRGRGRRHEELASGIVGPPLKAANDAGEGPRRPRRQDPPPPSVTILAARQGA